MPDATIVAAPPVLLVDDSTAAAMLGVSRSHLRAMHRRGVLPRPLRLGGRCVRWSVDELTRWAAAGCPDRRTWEADALKLTGT